MSPRSASRREDLLAGGRLPLDPLEGEERSVSEERLEEVLEELQLEAALEWERSDGELGAELRRGLDDRAEKRRREAEERRRRAASSEAGRSSSRALPELERAVERALAENPELTTADFVAAVEAADGERTCWGEELRLGEVEIVRQRGTPTETRRTVDGILADSNRKHGGVSLTSLPRYFQRARLRRESPSVSR
ncbi:MAG: hypothetical protein ACLF0P_17955 [Thermoanaerobaculia bacterium]